MVAYQFRQNITCPKCGSSNVKLRDNMYYVRLAKKKNRAYLLFNYCRHSTWNWIFVSAAQKKKQPIGMIQCLSCGKTKITKRVSCTYPKSQQSTLFKDIQIVTLTY
jgi:hypothetical protein